VSGYRSWSAAFGIMPVASLKNSWNGRCSGELLVATVLRLIRDMCCGGSIELNSIAPAICFACESEALMAEAMSKSSVFSRAELSDSQSLPMRK